MGRDERRNQETEPLTQTAPEIPDSELRPVAKPGDRFGQLETTVVCERCSDPRTRAFYWDRGGGATWIVLKCDLCGGRLDSFLMDAPDGGFVRFEPWNHTRKDDRSRRRTRSATNVGSFRPRQECAECHEQNHPRGCIGPDFWGDGGKPNPRDHGKCDECKRDDLPLLHCGARPPFPMT